MLSNTCCDGAQIIDIIVHPLQYAVSHIIPESGSFSADDEFIAFPISNNSIIKDGTFRQVGSTATGGAVALNLYISPNGDQWKRAISGIGTIALATSPDAEKRIVLVTSVFKGARKDITLYPLRKVLEDHVAAGSAPAAGDLPLAEYGDAVERWRYGIGISVNTILAGMTEMHLKLSYA